MRVSAASPPACAGCLLSPSSQPHARSPYQDIVIDYTVAAGNVTFSLTCSPQSIASPPPLAWCAFGLNTPGKGTDRAPANIGWLGVDTTTGLANVVEDRIITVAALPPCAATQLTSTSAASYTGGVLSATFTRPLAVAPALQAQGYVSVVDAPMSMIAAIGGGARGAGGPCSAGYVEHYGAFHNIWLDFAAT